VSTPSDDLSVSEVTLDINRRHGSDAGNAVARYTVWRTISETPGLGFKRGKEWRVPRTNVPRVEAALGLTRPTAA
jgi:hypothetical protein